MLGFKSFYDKPNKHFFGLGLIPGQDISCGFEVIPWHSRPKRTSSKVGELIDQVSGSWEEQLVKDIFWEEDAVNILAISVRSGPDDIVAWHFDTKGIFSVKSAYHVLEDHEEQAD